MESPVKKEKGKRLWFRVVLFLVPRIVTGYFRLVALTSKVIFLNKEHEENVCDKQAFACACFHGTMLYPIFYCCKYDGVIMVSRSWDGEIIDRVIRRWGFDTTRGSSSRRGKEALDELVELIKEKDYCSGLAVDAPRGPSRKVKIGIVMTAKRTGKPIVPLLSWATRKIQFKSWDRMILPLPFSTIVMGWGKPTFVPDGLEPDDYERIRQEIEDEMNRVQKQTEDKVEELMTGRSTSKATAQAPQQ